MNDRDCESCKMHEFTLHSATKYKDGTSIMSEPEKVYCDTDSALIHGETDTYATRKAAKNSMFGKTAEEMSNQLDPEFCEFGTCPYYDKFCDHTLQDKHGCAYLPHTPEANIKYLEQTFTEFAKTQDDIIEEYDATLKTHGDTLEQHMKHIDGLSKEYDMIFEKHADRINILTDNVEEHLNRICELEHLYEKVIDYVCELRERIDKIAESHIEHKGSNFCGNCTHVNKCRAEDGIYACELSGEIVDPDDSSCAMFEPPF